jgi:hypothetical protein
MPQPHLQLSLCVCAATSVQQSRFTIHKLPISNHKTEASMLLLIILLVLLFGGGGGYYGYSRWGTGGGLGILGTVLLIVLVVYLLSGLS